MSQPTPNQREIEMLEGILRSLEGDDTPTLLRREQVYRAILERRDRGSHPREWAIAQQHLGIQLGALGFAERSVSRLKEARSAFRLALEEMTRERSPPDWAMTQNNLANALWLLGELEGDLEQQEESIAASRLALEESTPERSLVRWAQSQAALAYRLAELGGKEKSTARLEEAIAALQEVVRRIDGTAPPELVARNQWALAHMLATLGKRERASEHLQAAEVEYELSLKVFTRQHAPADWARIKDGLASVYFEFGDRTRGAAALEKAIEAYRDALGELTRERAVDDWARIQESLGNALVKLGQQEGGTERFEEAIEAFRLSLDERTPGRSPELWAQTQHSLGGALASLGEREGGMGRLEEAVATFQLALKQRTRDRAPAAWAATQKNLGTALGTLGERKGDRALLGEGVAALRLSVDATNRDLAPLEWANTQQSLGLALAKLGSEEKTAALMEEAVVAFRLALEEQTTQAAAQERAISQHNLAIALEWLGKRERGTKRFEEAETILRSALGERRREEAPYQWAVSQATLASVLESIGERQEGVERLTQAVAAYRLALEELSRERSARQWAQTQNNLGNALFRLGEREPGTVHFDEAAAAYRNCLEELTLESAPREWVQTNHNLGRALVRLAEWVGGAHWREAAMALENALNSGLAAILATAGLQQQRRALAELGGLGDLAALAWVVAGDPIRAFKAAHRGRAIQATAIVLADERSTDSVASKELRSRRSTWIAADAAADSAYRGWESTQRQPDWESFQSALGSARQAFDRFRESLPSPSELDLAAVAAAIPGAGALVTLAMSERGGVAILLRAGASELHTLKLPALTITPVRGLLAGGNADEASGWFRGYGRFREAIDSGDGAPESALRQWNAIITETLAKFGDLALSAVQVWLRETLQIAPGEEIILSQPGWLAVIPLAAAPDRATGRCLLDDYAVRSIPNAELLLRCRATADAIDPASYSLLAAVDPTEDLLPSEHRESPGCDAFDPSRRTLLAGANATVEQVQKRIGDHTHYLNYGHGGWSDGGFVLFLAPDPTRPGDDGRLTEPDIRRMRLERNRLTILAACETGLIALGETPDEFMGLVESFLQAGAAAVVSSLWLIEARVTGELVGNLLHGCVLGDDFGRRLSPAQALRREQLRLRDQIAHEFGEALPVFWAAFACSGA
jgi:hypothetical protein